MKKPAPADPPIHPLLTERWSPRAYLPDALPEGALDQLLEAARWAPSCANSQPWRFRIFHRGTPEHASFSALFTGFNQVWAPQAPVLILGATSYVFENGKPNPHGAYDLGQAVAHLSVQATALGLSVHQMAGFDREAAKAFVPEGMDPLVVFTVGFAGEPEQLSPPNDDRERAPRTRKPRADIVL